MNPESQGRFGLKEDTVDRIRKVFSSYTEIERVVLYGSRAQGNYHDRSDIDLTIIGDRVTAEKFTHILLDLDDLLLPYKIDLSLMRHLDNPALRAHIERVGVIFYDREKQPGIGSAGTF